MCILKNVICIVLLINTSWFQKTDCMENDEEDNIEVIPRQDIYNNAQYIKKFNNLLSQAQLKKTVNIVTEKIVDYFQDEEIIYVYSHGFGEIGDPEAGPVYPDGGLNFKEASFYTDRNVNLFIEDLHKKIQYKRNVTLIIAGKSMGSSIIINALYKLILIQENNTSTIPNVNKNEAEYILTAINKGKILLSVPALSMQHTCLVTFFSKLLSSTTIINISGLLIYSKFLFDNYKNTALNKKMYFFGFFVLTMLNFYNCSYKLENMYSKFIDRYIIPFITRYNYNPDYIKPLEAAAYVRRQVTCPIVIHCSKNDGILLNPNKETAQLYRNLTKYNEKLFDTWLLLSNDDTHDTDNNHYHKIKTDFIQLPLDQFKSKQSSFTNDNEWIRSSHNSELDKISTYSPSFFALGKSVCKLKDRL